MPTNPITLQSDAYYADARALLRQDHLDVNIFDLSSIDKVSINIGVGKLDAKQKTDVVEYLAKITGQEPKQINSRVSIAGFGLRKGMTVGVVTTLRGKRMRDFLFNLIYLALPRTRDFRGVSSSGFDQSYKVYSLGIENASIFHAVGFDSSVQFGMQVNIVFKTPSSTNKELLTKLKFPFKK